MTEILRLTDRKLALQSYSPSGKHLVLRSRSKHLKPTIIDLLFGGVEFLELAARPLGEVVVLRPSDEEAREAMMSSGLNSSTRARPWILAAEASRQTVFAESLVVYASDIDLGARTFGFDKYLPADHSEILFASDPSLTFADNRGSTQLPPSASLARLLKNLPRDFLRSPALALELLDASAGSGDAAELRKSLDVAFMAGLPGAAVRTLAGLLKADWHEAHLDVVLLLSLLKEEGGLQAICDIVSDLPAYLRSSHDPSFVDTCFLALLTISPDGMELIRGFLDSKDSVLRFHARRRLLLASENDQPVLPQYESPVNYCSTFRNEPD